MEVQVNAGQLVRAIAGQEISEVVERIAKKFGGSVTQLIEQFVQTAPSAKGTLELENSLFVFLLNAGRELMQWLFDSLEPELEQMPGSVQHRGASYRRLAEKTRRADVLTRFGKVELIRGGCGHSQRDGCRQTKGNSLSGLYAGDKSKDSFGSVDKLAYGNHSSLWIPAS